MFLKFSLPLHLLAVAFPIVPDHLDFIRTKNVRLSKYLIAQNTDRSEWEGITGSVVYAGDRPSSISLLI